MPRPEIAARERRIPRLPMILAAAVLVLIGARSIAQLIIEYQWWKELGQLATWESIILYSVAPVAISTLLAFTILWVVHARALIFAGTRLRQHKAYARLSTLVLA